MNNRWRETKKHGRLGKKGAQNHYGNGRTQSALAGWVLPLNWRKPLDHRKMISFRRPKRAVRVSREVLVDCRAHQLPAWIFSLVESVERMKIPFRFKKGEKGFQHDLVWIYSKNHWRRASRMNGLNRLLIRSPNNWMTVANKQKDGKFQHFETRKSKRFWLHRGLKREKAQMISSLCFNENTNKK